MKNMRVAQLNTILDEVKGDFDVFCPLMLHGVGGEVRGADVVTVDHGLLCGRSV